jgi:multiple sugar transport system substrate-binding protein
MRPVGHNLSRRRLLVLGGAATATTLLAACGGGAAPAAPSNPTPAPASGASTPVGASNPTTSASIIVLPDSGVGLPSGPVTFRWLGTAGERKLFVDQLIPAYQQKHPNITIQHDALPMPDIAKVLPAGIQSGQAPDIFELPSGFTGAQAVQQGWVRPLDDMIPNFDQWKAAFPPGALVEGSNIFKGKTYSFPFEGLKRNNGLLLFNADFLHQAGLDPNAQPFTWDTYRAAAKKLTQQAAGKYFGTIIAGQQPSRWSGYVAFLAEMDGATSLGSTPAVDINLKTGEYSYTSDEYLAALDLLLAVKSDGSFLPGTISLNVQQTDSQFAQGVAAMYINGPYTFPQWKIDTPSFNYDVASQPVPNSGTAMPMWYPAGGSTYWVYASTQQAAIAGDILAYAGSEVGQKALVKIIEGSQPSVFASANAQEGLEPRAKKALAIFDKQMRLAPVPELRNPDVALLYLEMKPLTPDFGTTVQGIFSGQLSDPKKAMQDVQDRATKELERAIQAAQSKGAKVSRDDFKFPNWDTSRDFTLSDYTGS